MRDPHGGLLKKLLSVETTRYENTMLQILRHAVNNGFYQGEGEQIGDEPVDDLDNDSDIGSVDDHEEYYDNEDYSVSHIQPAIFSNQPYVSHVPVEAPVSPISNCS